MNLLTLYSRYAGKSQVPAAYHLWSCLAVLAACVADRVYVEKHADARLAPNLFVLLTGPSGNGKGIAMGEALALLSDFPTVNVFVGQCTPEWLVSKWLSRSGDTVRDAAKTFLVLTELKNSVGVGESAAKFVTQMTDLYEGKAMHMRGTIAHGLQRVPHSCITLLGGSTLEWLVDAVPIKEFKAGFCRSVLVYEERSSKRYAQPEYAVDRDDLKAALIERLADLHEQARGEMLLTHEARTMHDTWYMHRPAPDDPDLVPGWQRGDDLWYKLAILASLADSLDGIVGVEHAALAQGLVDWIIETEGPRLFRRVAGGLITEGVQAIARYLRGRSGAVGYAELLTWGHSHNLMERQLNEALKSLVRAKQAMAEPVGGEPGYRWVEQEGKRYGVGGLVEEWQADEDEDDV